QRRLPPPPGIGAGGAFTARGLRPSEGSVGVMTMEAITLTVNGRARQGMAEPRKTLADFLREDLQLTGTHLGCEHGVCGACTVLMDGVAVRSCLMLALQARGAEVTTIEGLERDGALHPLQEA